MSFVLDVIVAALVGGVVNVAGSAHYRRRVKFLEVVLEHERAYVAALECEAGRIPNGLERARRLSARSARIR